MRWSWLSAVAAASDRTGPDQLSTLDSLLEQLPPVQLALFRQQLIEPLAERDRRRGTHHVRTLRAFLATNGSLSDTARDLYLTPTRCATGWPGSSS